MRAPRPRLGVPLGMVLVAIFASAGVVYATTGSGITTTQIVQGNFGDIDVKTNFDGHKVDIDTKGDSDLYVVSNVIAPGGHTGWHTHPGPSLITVKSGTITAYQGDDPNCSPTVYTVGQGFVDPLVSCLAVGGDVSLPDTDEVVLVRKTAELTPEGGKQP